LSGGLPLGSPCAAKAVAATHPSNPLRGAWHFLFYI
jgi:hypothetical protein